jgi:hypothetical protein
MNKKSVVKCQNSDIHRRSKQGGKILMILGDNNIFIQCRDMACKRWTRIGISFPGIKIDFSKAALTQSVMPEGYHFDISPAATVIGE